MFNNKKIFSDHTQYQTQYSQISSIIYNSNGKKTKLSIKPSFHKQAAHIPLANHLVSKIAISSIPSIYNKKVDEEYTGFSSKKSAVRFVRNVYFGVLIQLIFFIGMYCYSRFQPYHKSFRRICCTSLDRDQEENTVCPDKKGPCFWVPFASSFLTLILLACCEFHRRYPWNYIAVCYFTTSLGFLLMQYTRSNMVFFTLIVFATSIAGLTLFTCQTKLKYSLYSAIGIVAVSDVVTFLIFYYEVLIPDVFWRTSLYAVIAGSIFVVFFIMDLQMMVNGNSKYEIKETEYVFTVVMTLYTDMINFFIYVLQLLNSAKE